MRRPLRTEGGRSAQGGGQGESCLGRRLSRMMVGGGIHRQAPWAGPFKGMYQHLALDLESGIPETLEEEAWGQLRDRPRAALMTAVGRCPAQPVGGGSLGGPQSSPEVEPASILGLGALGAAQGLRESTPVPWAGLPLLPLHGVWGSD